MAKPAGSRPGGGGARFAAPGICSPNCASHRGFGTFEGIVCRDIRHWRMIHGASHEYLSGTRRRPGAFSRGMRAEILARKVILVRRARPALKARRACKAFWAHKGKLAPRVRKAPKVL